MADTKHKLQRFVKGVFNYRYLISIVIMILIMGLGFYLRIYRHWGFKDAAQVCTGFFIVITLFFTALNYEFSASKVKQDYKAAKELLTYNTATEWYKTPLKDYQKISIQFENKFIASNAVRTVDDFFIFITEPEQLEYKECFKGLLNSFETLAIGVYKELIDKHFMREFYRLIFESYYIDYYFFIESHRVKKDNDKIWINFTNLAEEWNPGIHDKLIQGVLKSSLIT